MAPSLCVGACSDVNACRECGCVMFFALNSAILTCCAMISLHECHGAHRLTLYNQPSCRASSG